jgi:hypothetical protein
MRNRIVYFLVLFLLIFGISCTKKNKQNSQETIVDCQQNNYGIVTITFTDNTVEHLVKITYSNKTFREKRIPIGVVEDTLRIKPDNLYYLNFSSLDTYDKVIENIEDHESIVSCQKYTVGVSF